MKYCFISCQSHNQVKEYIQNSNYLLLEIPEGKTVYSSIAAHADIYLCLLNNRPVLSPDLNIAGFPDHLIRQCVNGITKPQKEYPFSACYNGVQVGQRFIHNTNCTASGLMNEVRHHDLQIIHTKQGYTNCNLVIVDQNSAITSDRGLARTLMAEGMDILIIPPGYVNLPGFTYGFLGGASGLLPEEKKLLFHGDLRLHPEYEQICRFIHSKNVEPVFFPDLPLNDIGSILAFSC